VSATRAITLPHGLLEGGHRRSTAVLRHVTGADEADLAATRDRSRAEQVTGLLARCVVHVDGIEVDDEVVRRLTVGDREALLWHLRAGVFGDGLACIVDCPACGERMDIDLLVSDVLVPPYDDVHDRHTVSFDVDGEQAEVDVRLVTGEDQEEAARKGGGEAGVEELLARCVLDVRTSSSFERSSPSLADALSDTLAELDPQAEVTIDAACPSCGHPLTALVDGAAILFAELTKSDDRLLREVDAIARAYHWSEDAILSLDVQRRRRYLDLLAEEVEAP
jgi:hypothetical protein